MTDITAKSILLMASNPKGSQGLRLQEEEREIRERLRLAGYGKTPINSTGATRPRDVQQAMLDFKPQIVHFSGHGVGEEGLVFEDMAGLQKLVGTAALANLFRLFSHRVECVVLNACYSRFQAEAIAKHIEYVIGMSQGIGDKAAIEFSVGFYSALGSGESIDFAYELGCNAIQFEGLSENLTPVLYKKGKLLQIYIGNLGLPENETISDEYSEISSSGIDVSKYLSINSSTDSTAEEISSKNSDGVGRQSQDMESDNQYVIAIGLIDALFDALSSSRVETGIQKFEMIAHQSLFQNGQIEANFLRNSFKVAVVRLKLYKQPIEIVVREPTGRTKIGERGNREEGKEEKYVIASQDQRGGYQGNVRIFFPANGNPAKISDLNF
jgi:hypothetical protein